jgi:hypothetical protein
MDTRGITGKRFKKLTYGVCDFREIIRRGYAYVDKTPYIEMLEGESNPNQFFIRPRKFGKSLFFMTLSYYYGRRYAGEFEELFGGLYIGRQPTPEHNRYLVMEFDFSGISTAGEEDFKTSFGYRVELTSTSLLRLNRAFLPNAEEAARNIESAGQGVFSFSTVMEVVRQAGLQVYVIIDEYDHFANDLIALGKDLGDDVYRRMSRSTALSGTSMSN